MKIVFKIVLLISCIIGLFTKLSLSIINFNFFFEVIRSSIGILNEFRQQLLHYEIALPLHLLGSLKEISHTVTILNFNANDISEGKWIIPLIYLYCLQE